MTENWRLNAVLKLGGIVFALAFGAMMACGKKPNTEAQLAYQEGYTVGYHAGVKSQQDKDFEAAMRQGEEALAILEKWEKAGSAGCEQACSKGGK